MKYSRQRRAVEEDGKTDSAGTLAFRDQIQDCPLIGGAAHKSVTVSGEESVLEAGLYGERPRIIGNGGGRIRDGEVT